MKRAFLSLCLIVILLVSGCRPAGVQAVPGEFPTQPVINAPLELPPAADAFPTISERHPDVPEEFDALAENGTLRLYARRDTSAIIVEDLRSGRLWYSTPADLRDNTSTNTAWRRQMELPVQVSFVDAERAQSKNAKVERDTDYIFSAVENGARVRYQLNKFELAFDVVYALQDDCLVSAIPEASIEESGINGLVSIDLLAFFGATHDGQDGYIVYPDGSGALMSFTSPHPAEVQKINTTIYGSDASGGLIGNTFSNFREQVSIPLFGLVSGPEGGTPEERAGFAAMITHGDFDATMGVGRSGKGLNYNHVWTTFIFRRPGRFSLTGGNPAWLYQPDRITGDRAVRYCFMNGEDASYVTMGQRYRDFLIEERGARRMEAALGADGTAVGAGEDAQLRTSVPRMNLGLFMGIERRTWFLSDMITMTTFEQTQAILDDLDKAGVRDIDVSLFQWDVGSTANRLPERLPADPRLGGDDALSALGRDVSQRGQRLFLTDSYIGVPPRANGFTPYLDAARGVDGLPVGDSEMGYLINPQVALRSYAMRDVPKMQQLNATGLLLSDMAYLAIPDKNQRYPLSRENFAATYMQIGTLARDLLGSVSMMGSNVYAVPYVDRLDYVPIDSTHYDLFETTVPLYQIAIHGLVQYSHQPYNLLSDGKRLFLREIEYGATPFFLLTENNSAQLFRTDANSLYSSQYRYWRDEVVRQYNAVGEMEHTLTQFITGHAQIARNVYATTYEDGTQVIVNYGAQPYEDGGISVPPADFIVVQGE